jgi:hypothetical protein
MTMFYNAFNRVEEGGGSTPDLYATLHVVTKFPSNAGKTVDVSARRFNDSEHIIAHGTLSSSSDSNGLYSCDVIVPCIGLYSVRVSGEHNNTLIAVNELYEADDQEPITVEVGKTLYGVYARTGMYSDNLYVDAADQLLEMVYRPSHSLTTKTTTFTKVGGTAYKYFIPSRYPYSAVAAPISMNTVDSASREYYNIPDDHNRIEMYAFKAPSHTGVIRAISLDFAFTSVYASKKGGDYYKMFCTFQKVSYYIRLYGHATSTSEAELICERDFTDADCVLQSMRATSSNAASLEFLYHVPAALYFNSDTDYEYYYMIISHNSSVQATLGSSINDVQMYSDQANIVPLLGSPTSGGDPAIMRSTGRLYNPGAMLMKGRLTTSSLQGYVQSNPGAAFTSCKRVKHIKHISAKAYRTVSDPAELKLSVENDLPSILDSISSSQASNPVYTFTVDAIDTDPEEDDNVIDTDVVCEPSTDVCIYAKTNLLSASNANIYLHSMCISGYDYLEM